jgi:hypothetical protein
MDFMMDIVLSFQNRGRLFNWSVRCAPESDRAGGRADGVWHSLIHLQGENHGVHPPPNARKEPTAARAAVSLVRARSSLATRSWRSASSTSVSPITPAWYASCERSLALCKAPISTTISSRRTSDCARRLNESSTSSVARSTELRYRKRASAFAPFACPTSASTRPKSKSRHWSPATAVG